MCAPAVRSLIVLSCVAATAAPAAGQFTVTPLTSVDPEIMGHFGWTVAGAGDADGDGIGDVVVGAPFEDAHLFGDGRAYVFSSVTGSIIHLLSSPHAQVNGRFGVAVAGAGDVDGDGRPDVIVGASEDATVAGPFVAGRAYVFSGANGSVLLDLVSPTPEFGGGFGLAVAGAGDINTDRHADVIVGAQFEDGGMSDAGRAYAFSGLDGSLLRTFSSPDPQASGGFGNFVAGAGDVDGDGGADVVIGASNESGGAAGRVYVFRAASGDVVHTLESPNPENNGEFGSAVAGAGDLDGDTHADILVGALGEDGGSGNAGRAYLFSGTDGSLMRTFTSPNNEASGSFGKSIDSVPDVDGDGLRDILVAAPNEDAVHVDAGRVYIFSSADGGRLLHTMTSPDAEAGALFGFSAGSAGDVNNDGSGDVVVGTFFGDGGALNSGSAYVFASDAGPAIPVVSAGSAAALVLLMMAGGTIVIMRRRFGPRLIPSHKRRPDTAGALHSGRNYLRAWL